MILLDKKASIFRLTKSGNAQRQSTFTVSIEATKQPLGQDKALMWGGSHGKIYRMFFNTGIQIKEGDQIKMGSDTFKVMAGGIDDRDDGFVTDYVGVTCELLE